MFLNCLGADEIRFAKIFTLVLGYKAAEKVYSDNRGQIAAAFS